MSRVTEDILGDVTELEKMVELVSLFGLLGSITASILFFPQVWKAWKVKKTKELSWLMICIGIFNGLFWTAYGVLKLDPFIYVTNTLLTSALVMLAVLKMRYDKNG